MNCTKTTKFSVAALLAYFLLIASTTTVHATEAYEYANTVVHSLAELRTATEQPMTEQSTTTADDPLAGLSNVMHSYITMRSQIKDAAFPLEQYKASSDKNISSSAEILLNAFQIFDANLEKTITNLEKILNDPEIVQQKYGTTKREVYQAEANFQKAWDILGKAAAVSALSLQDQNRLVDDKFHYLKITRAERQQLQQLLEKDFGSAVKDSNKATNDIFPASLLWTYLANDKWANADDK